MIRCIRFSLQSLTLLLAIASSAHAADDSCSRFTWDVSRELAVMKQSPQSIDVAVKPNAAVPMLALDKLYELKLVAQSEVTFAAPVGKPMLADGAEAGLVRFQVSKAGNYRVSMTSGHWIDIVDGTQLIKSRDFQGQRGCERPHKIVEFTLPAGRELILQFSGATEAHVVVAITPAPAPVVN